MVSFVPTPLENMTNKLELSCAKAGVNLAYSLGCVDFSCLPQVEDIFQGMPA